MSPATLIFRPVVKHILFLSLSVLALVACGQKTDNSAIQHRYQLTGRVVSLNAKNQTATIDAAAIADFMEAMTMEYPVKLKSEFETLHAGDHISATIDVHEDHTFEIEGIHKETPNR